MHLMAVLPINAGPTCFFERERRFDDSNSSDSSDHPDNFNRSDNDDNFKPLVIQILGYCILYWTSLSDDMVDGANFIVDGLQNVDSVQLCPRVAYIVRCYTLLRIRIYFPHWAKRYLCQCANDAIVGGFALDGRSTM